MQPNILLLLFTSVVHCATPSVDDTSFCWKCGRFRTGTGSRTRAKLVEKGSNCCFLTPLKLVVLYKESRKILDEQAPIKTPKYRVVVKEEKHQSAIENTAFF